MKFNATKILLTMKSADNITEAISQMQIQTAIHIKISAKLTRKLIKERGCLKHNTPDKKWWVNIKKTYWPAYLELQSTLYKVLRPVIKKHQKNT